MYFILNGGFWGPYIEDVEDDGADQNETSDDYDEYYDDDESYDNDNELPIMRPMSITAHN